MILRRSRIAMLMAVMMLPGGARAQETSAAEVDSIPSEEIFLKNRTTQTFGCTVNNTGNGSLYAFQLAPGAEYYRSALRDPVRMTCGGVAYTLSAGARYAIQPTGNGFAIQEIRP